LLKAVEDARVVEALSDENLATEMVCMIFNRSLLPDALFKLLGHRNAAGKYVLLRNLKSTGPECGLKRRKNQLCEPRAG
jgi:hypothetical protein